MKLLVSSLGGISLDTFSAPMRKRVQRCHYVRDRCGSDLETVSLRRFHRNAAAAAAAAAAPSLRSQEAVSFNSINSDVIAPKA